MIQDLRSRGPCVVYIDGISWKTAFGCFANPSHCSILLCVCIVSRLVLFSTRVSWFLCKAFALDVVSSGIHPLCVCWEGGGEVCVCVVTLCLTLTLGRQDHVCL